MTTLLHISASPRGQRSESLAIATTFLDELRATHPEVGVEHWDLWDGTLPEFGPNAAAAKMSVFAGADPEGDEAAAWRAAHENKGEMVRWGILVAGLLVLGSIPLFVGLAFVLPWLGYSTWHLYTRLVDRGTTP